MTLQGLEPAALVLGLLYLSFAVAYIVRMPDHALVLAPAAFVTSGFLLTLHAALRRACWLHLSPHLLAGLVGGCVLVNALLRLVLTGDPLQTINLILLLVGAGYLFLNSRLYLVLIGVAVAGWFGCAVTVVGSVAALQAPPWRSFGIGLIAAAGLGIILQIARIRGYQHLEHLRKETELQAERQRQRAAHLETLINVGHSINSFLNLDALLDHVVQTLYTAFGYDYVGVFLIDDRRQHLVARAGTGEIGRALVAQAYALAVDDVGLVGWAATHREAAWTNDASCDPRYVTVDFLPDICSEMALPLEVGDTLLGVLDIQSARPAAFSEDDLRVCLSLADQIASAIVNASRYEAEHTRRALAETLYAVGRALSRTLNVSEVLDLILDGLGRVVTFDRGAVLLEREGELEFAAARGFPPGSNPLEMRVAIRDGDVYEQINQAKAPLIIAEIGDRADWEYVENLPRARSWAGLPLTDAEDHVIGMLSLARELPIPYTDDEVALGAALAGQAGVALHNARLYMELSEAYSQLAHLDRAKSDFIALASHELRTPLTLVTGYSQILASEASIRADSEISCLVGGLVQGTIRLQEIVERIMDLAEIENQLLCLSFSRVSLAPMLAEVVQGFKTVLSERNLHMVIEERPECPDIDADHVALSKALRHLLVNAIKYTPDGGDIHVAFLLHTPDGNGAGDPSVEIVVADTGVGIDACDRERIFDKFHQTGEISLHSSGSVKFMGGGPGLGLAIVKGIVEAHGGVVWAQSPGHDRESCPGSSFHVRLPVRQRLASNSPIGLPVTISGELS